MRKLAALFLLNVLLLSPAFAEVPAAQRELEEDIRSTCAEVMEAGSQMQMAIDTYGNNVMSADVQPYWRMAQLKKERLMALSDRYKHRYGVWPDVCVGLKAQLELREQMMKRNQETQNANARRPHTPR